MRHYETTFVIDSLLKAEEIDAIIGKYERFISANGGELLRVERWGKRRLTYEIKKRQYGYYVHTRFFGPSNIPKLLEREYRLNESILRYLTLVLDKKALAQEAKSLKDVRTVAPKPDSTGEVLANEDEFDIDFHEDEDAALDSVSLSEDIDLNPEDMLEHRPLPEQTPGEEDVFSQADREVAAPPEQNTTQEQDNSHEKKSE